MVAPTFPPTVERPPDSPAPAPEPHHTVWRVPAGPPLIEPGPVAPPAAPGGRPRAAWPGRAAWTAATVALALVAGAVGGRLSAGDGGAVTTTTAASSAATTGVSYTAGGLDVGAVLAQVQDSVVSIDTTVRTRQGPFVSEGQGAGSGIILDDQGHVLTNAHVVDGATSITVTLNGETEARTATLVAADTAADVAVLLVDDPTGLVPARLATATPTVGEPVLAIGNALALEGSLTVTEGIVSAVDRSISAGTDESLTDLIQTDAAISSGNSGGPLVNSAGEVIGMNTAVASSSSSVQASNIGFAISIDHARSVAAELLALG